VFALNLSPKVTSLEEGRRINLGAGECAEFGIPSSASVKKFSSRDPYQYHSGYQKELSDNNAISGRGETIGKNCKTSKIEPWLNV
jgi:hypothetical protein